VSPTWNGKEKFPFPVVTLGLAGTIVGFAVGFGVGIGAGVGVSVGFSVGEGVAGASERNETSSSVAEIITGLGVGAGVGGSVGEVLRLGVGVGVGGVGGVGGSSVEATFAVINLTFWFCWHRSATTSPKRRIINASDANNNQYKRFSFEGVGVGGVGGVGGLGVERFLLL